MDRNHKPSLCDVWHLVPLAWRFLTLFHSERFYGQAVATFLFHPNWRMESIIGNTLESILLRSHRLFCLMFGILHDISWAFFPQKAFYGQVLASCTAWMTFLSLFHSERFFWAGLSKIPLSSQLAHAKHHR